MTVYRSNADLPGQIRNVLPPEAQTLYRDTFNAAWTGYVMPIRRGCMSRHDTYAARMAWTAVRRKFVEDSDTWIRRQPATGQSVG